MKACPRSWLLCTVMHPPCCATMPRRRTKPRPVPTPTGFVVRNGRKMRCTVASSMPHPCPAREMRSALVRAISPALAVSHFNATVMVPIFSRSLGGVDDEIDHDLMELRRGRLRPSARFDRLHDLDSAGGSRATFLAVLTNKARSTVCRVGRPCAERQDLTHEIAPSLTRLQITRDWSLAALFRQRFIVSLAKPRTGTSVF